VIKIAVFTIAAVVVWVLAGRRLTQLIDRVYTVRTASQKLKLVAYSGGTLYIGDVPLFLTAMGSQPLDVRFANDSRGNVTINVGSETFVLGPEVRLTAESMPVESAFAPEPGDEAIFTTEHSLISWPTPLELNFMTGHSPSWKRYTYYRLTWKKSSGAVLRMRWRYEQWFYGNDNVVHQMLSDSTGLISARIEGK
jgi:hypothetical protein